MLTLLTSLKIQNTEITDVSLAENEIIQHAQRWNDQNTEHVIVKVTLETTKYDIFIERALFSQQCNSVDIDDI